MPEFWVRSDVMPDGSYGVTITVDSDIAFALDGNTIGPYVTACFHTATTADHCIAVLRLMIQKMQIPEAEATQFVRTFTDVRNHASTAPLRFDCAVGRAKYPRPDAGAFVSLVMVSCAGKELGWIEPAQLRDHAAAVLDSLTASHLDGRLRAALMQDMGVDDATARAFVGNLADFMPGQEGKLR
jgi:hypothetical protein